MLVTFLFLTVIAIFPAYSAAEGDILTIVGTGDNQRLLRRLAKSYEDRHPGLTVEIPDSIGSNGGIRSVISGKHTMARVARPLRQNEIDQGLKYSMFAMTPVVLIIHQSVTGIDTVSESQVSAIFNRNIHRWNELRGPDNKIYLVNREDGDSSLRAIENSIPGFRGISPPPESVFYSTPETMAALAKYPYTIGYGPLTMIPETNVRCLQLNGVVPSPENLQNGTYPLRTPLGFAWKGELPPKYRDFMEFLSTPEAAQVIRANGALPVGSPPGK